MYDSGTKSVEVTVVVDKVPSKPDRHIGDLVTWRSAARLQSRWFPVRCET
jgi:hypothetical protein